MTTPSLPIPPFPLPPIQYIAGHSDENINRGRAPPPPVPPAKGGEPFYVFGAPQWHDDHIVRPFESLSIRRLYPQSFDRKKELKKALHSILATFLDLIDVLVKCPVSQKRNDKLEDMNLLFIHFQHMLNEYRVHQARDGIRSMLEVQRRQTLDVTDRLNLHVDKASEMVALCIGPEAQTQLTEKLKWDIAQLQAKRADLLANDPTPGDEARKAPPARLFDQFMCDLVGQEDETDSTDWMMQTDQPAEGSVILEENTFTGDSASGKGRFSAK